MLTFDPQDGSRWLSVTCAIGIGLLNDATVPF